MMPNIGNNGLVYQLLVQIRNHFENNTRNPILKLHMLSGRVLVGEFVSARIRDDYLDGLSLKGKEDFNKDDLWLGFKNSIAAHIEYMTIKIKIYLRVGYEVQEVAVGYIESIQI